MLFIAQTLYWTADLGNKIVIIEAERVTNTQAPEPGTKALISPSGFGHGDMGIMILASLTPEVYAILIHAMAKHGQQPEVIKVCDIQPYQ